MEEQYDLNVYLYD